MGKIGCILAKVARFEQSDYIRAKLLHSDKNGCFLGKNGCNSSKWLYLGKVVVFGQKWLYSGKVVILGQK